MAINTRLATGETVGSGTITVALGDTYLYGTGTSFTAIAKQWQEVWTTTGGVGGNGQYVGTIATVQSTTNILLTSGAALAVTAGGYKIVSPLLNTVNNPLSTSQIDNNFVTLSDTKESVSRISLISIPYYGVRRDANGKIFVDAVNTQEITGMTTALSVAQGGTGAATASAARTSLGLAIGTNVQAYDADLDAVAGVSSVGILTRTGAGTASARTLDAGSGIGISNGAGTSGNPTISNTGVLSINGFTGSLTSVGAVGGSTDKVFYENDNVITTNYTITAGKNAMTAGPVTINNGVTVTVSSGSVWTIV